MICVVCIDLLKNIPFKTDPATKQLAKQLIIQGAMEQDTENETENEELPGIFFIQNSHFIGNLEIHDQPDRFLTLMSKFQLDFVTK